MQKMTNQKMTNQKMTNDSDDTDYYFQTRTILIIGAICLLLVSGLVYYFLFRDGKNDRKSRKK
jgi:hypothetical protein